MSRPFRFALTLGDVRDRSSLLDLVRRTEDGGFDVLAGVDHIGPPAGVMPLLAAAAQVSSLRVSTMVIANDYRHPVVLAKDAATIDVLSEGRFELGIGTGWIRDQYASAGFTYDDAAVRVDRLAEALEVIKGCWSGREYRFVGTHYRVDLTGSPVPLQRPRPPLLLGAAGPRMLRLAARQADIVGITVTHGLTGFGAFAHAVATSGQRIDEQLKTVREAAGERFSTLELSVMIHHLAPSADEVMDLAGEIGVGSNTIFGSPHLLAGPPEHAAETLLERRERLGISYVVFRGADLDLAEPIVSHLAGR